MGAQSPRSSKELDLVAVGAELHFFVLSAHLDPVSGCRSAKQKYIPIECLDVLLPRSERAVMPPNATRPAFSAFSVEPVAKLRIAAIAGNRARRLL